MENVVPIVHQGLEAIAWPLDAGTDRALTKEPQEFRISGMVAHLKHAGIVFAVSTMRFKKKDCQQTHYIFFIILQLYMNLFTSLSILSSIYIYIHNVQYQYIKYINIHNMYIIYIFCK